MLSGRMLCSNSSSLRCLQAAQLSQASQCQTAHSFWLAAGLPSLEQSKSAQLTSCRQSATVASRLQLGMAL